MLIGLLSDTHIPDAVLGLPPELNRIFQDVDLILHAGDIFTSSVLDELESMAPVYDLAGCRRAYRKTRRVDCRNKCGNDGHFLT